MGFLGLGNYSKPGPGVDKDAPERRSGFKFFELYFRKFWQIMNVALIYFFAAIPTFIITLAASFFIVSAFCNLNGGAFRLFLELQGNYMYFVVVGCFLISVVYTILIGAGPATAGLSFVLSSFAGDYHSFIWQDFKEKFKENFKQGIAVYFVDLIAFVALSYAFMVYYSYGGWISNLRYIIVVIALLFAAMHLYIYPMMVSYNLKVWQIYKNAFLLTMATLPISLILLIINLVIHFLVWSFLIGLPFNMLPVFLLVEGFLLYGLSGFISNFRSEIVFKRYFKI